MGNVRSTHEIGLIIMTLHLCRSTLGLNACFHLLVTFIPSQDVLNSSKCRLGLVVEVIEIGGTHPGEDTWNPGEVVGKAPCRHPSLAPAYRPDSERPRLTDCNSWAVSVVKTSLNDVFVVLSPAPKGQSCSKITGKAKSLLDRQPSGVGDTLVVDRYSYIQLRDGDIETLVGEHLHGLGDIRWYFSTDKVGFETDPVERVSLLQ